MTDYDSFTENKSCNSDRFEESGNTYCTNPIIEPEEVSRISWLDDYGWI